MLWIYFHVLKWPFTTSVLTAAWNSIEWGTTIYLTALISLDFYVASHFLLLQTMLTQISLQLNLCTQTPQSFLRFLEVELLKSGITVLRFLMNIAKLLFLNVVLIFRPTDCVWECSFADSGFATRRAPKLHQLDKLMRPSYILRLVSGAPQWDPSGQFKTVPWECVLCSSSWCLHKSLLKPSTSSNIYLTSAVG